MIGEKVATVLRCEFNVFSLTDEDLIVFLSSLMLIVALLYQLSNFRPIIKCIKPIINLILTYFRHTVVSQSNWLNVSKYVGFYMHIERSRKTYRPTHYVSASQATQNKAILRVKCFRTRWFYFMESLVMVVNVTALMSCFRLETNIFPSTELIH